MGWRVKVRLTLATCGTCGKPRGITHACVTRATSTRRKRRTTVRPRVTATCGKCGKPRGIAHTCHIKTDFKKRRRQAARAEKAAERRQRRADAKRKRAEAARARKAAAKAAPKRPRPQHDYRTCRDDECERYVCRIYREGIEDCPLSHGG